MRWDGMMRSMRAQILIPFHHGRKDIEKAKRTKLIKHIYIGITIFFLGGQGVD